MPAEDSTDLAGCAVFWRGRTAHRWEAQPYLWPRPAAIALAQRLVSEFGGEAFLAPIAEPTRLVTMARPVSTDLGGPS